MTTSLLRDLRPLALPLVGLAAPACDAGSEPSPPTREWIDHAPPIPAGRPVPPDAIAPVPAEDGSDCGPRSGTLPDGTCRLLATREAGYVERVLLPAGRFVMGRVPLVYDARESMRRRVARWPNQPPRYGDVASFWIDLVEVTREAYAECVAAGACSEARCLDGSDGRREDLGSLEGLPQTCVTHDQAEAFCAFRGGRLPTATEWEYAARGPDSRVFPWGNEIRDELTDAIMPVGVRVDTSYFGILGLGSNANEWVADRFDPDVGLAPFASDFRRPDGPSARARHEWELKLQCGTERDKCALDESDTLRYGVKGPAVVGLRAARARAPRAHQPQTTIEGWKEVAQHPQLGFRCAADVSPEDPSYVVPALPPQIPWIVRTEGGLEIFGGIAEAVSRAEARRFCEALHLPRDEPGAWRLPSAAEIDASASFFRGPGPVWSADGALHQRPGEDAWAVFDTGDEGDEAALLARCVRSG